MRTCLAAVSVLIAAALPPAPARAAETFHACIGFIDTVPATITSQGVWCLRQDLSTATASGNAITVSANNVTIDCNAFKLGGLAAGAATQTHGIRASSRQNVTVRNCNVRGFFSGISIDGGAGHLVEDNQLDNNLVSGIVVLGDNAVVRRNRVSNTGGGTPTFIPTAGIFSDGDLLHNHVNRVTEAAAGNDAYGIWATGGSASVRGNQVLAVLAGTGGSSYGIHATGPSQRIAGNHVMAQGTSVAGTGLNGPGVNTTCLDNTVGRYATAFSGCEASADNLVLP